MTFDAEQEQIRRPRTLGRVIALLVLGVALLFLFGGTLLGSWVDLLWFRSLGYGDVFWKARILQAGLFAGFGLLTFVMLYGIFRAYERLHQNEMPETRTLVLNGRPVEFSVQPVLRVLRWGVSLVVGFFTAASMAESWPTLALWWYGARTRNPSEVLDPIFGRPLSFFLFRLPGWQILVNWLLMLSIVAVLAGLLFLGITAGARSADRRRLGDGTSPWRGLLLAMSFLLLVAAANLYLDRFDRLFEHHTIFDGVTYTDAHVMLPGLLLVCVALAAGAGITAQGALRNAGGASLLLSVAPAVLCYGGLTVVAWYVSSFVVKPNELVREMPYIAHNIDLTRQAYGLDRFTQSEFPAETTVAAADPSGNQPTLNNIRLWDWHALQDTLRQVQEIRTYYDFPDIDIDRYTISGTTREVMLAARELNVEKLPESSRNWINEKLIYTHGYGVTMNPVNGFTPEGLPTFLLRDMPVQSSVPGLTVTRPEVYFGQLTDTDVYVKTRQQEFDYPQGQTNSLTSYGGDGGIVLGGFVRRLLIALDRGDLGKVPFSDDIGPESRLLMRRNLRERVATLAPFLTLDQDPYLVVNEDGRLSWIIDAFTTSETYPYATHTGLGDGAVNYMRNSVKVVIDPYNGTTTFYVFDSADPVLAAYRGLFPSLFRDGAEMPAGLRRHVRYPELLFRVQSAMYGLYHMTNPAVFFNREDLWTVATETASDSNGGQTPRPMSPNYVLMKLPGGTAEEFVEILPFTPANRNNLIGWIAGRCDGENYGKAMVYDFPKSRLVDGPQQIEARIDQNAQLSGQLTLWNQQGSHVVRGSLLVIPTGRALLYAEPIYLQAQQSPMPELRLVVLALQDKLAYGPTFEAALQSLFGEGAAASAAMDTLAGSGAPVRADAGQDLQMLIAQASRAFADYQRLTSEGKLSEAGQKLDELKHLLGVMQARGK